MGGSVKLYTDGTFHVTAGDRGTTEKLFEAAARQLTRSVKCTGCGVCDEVCVAVRYMGRILGG